MRTTATMVIGFDETLDERLEHLQRTRDFQDECLATASTGCSRSCAGRTSRTAPRSAAARSRRERVPAQIALSRIFLDNVPHVRTSVLTQNEDAFRALDYGADDFDLPIEDEVTQKAGARIDLDLEALLAVPRALGYTVEYRRAERPAALDGRMTLEAADDRYSRRRRGRGAGGAACDPRRRRELRITQLRKPAWTPPLAGIRGRSWTVLYAQMAYSAARVARSPTRSARRALSSAGSSWG